MSFAFLNDIIQYSFWPSLLMLVFGIAGNVLLFIIYSRIKKLSITLYFRVGALVDLFITLNWLKIFIRDKYHIYLTNISSFMCKSVQFSIITAGPISSFIQLVISFDRLVHIAYPAKCSFLSSFKFQVCVLVVVFGANIGYFFFLIIDYDLIITTTITTLNDSNTTITTTKRKCILKTISYDLLYWLETANTFVPFAMMTLASVLMIVFIKKSRQRLSKRPRKSQIRDLKFAITAISLNFFFLLTNMPNPLYSLATNQIYTLIDPDLDNFFITLSVFVWYVFYVFNFYLQLVVNSLVRDEFFRIIGKRADGGNKFITTVNARSMTA